jgi:polyisoprenoid-binding protein YceI
MKRTIVSGIFSLVLFAFLAFAPKPGKMVSTKTHIKFFSTTALENIEANNYKSVSTFDTQTGEVVFSVPMQSFEFEKALMQKHFNSENFLNTKANPKAKLVAKLSDLAEFNPNKNGTYNASFKGEMTINGKSNSINEKAAITVNGTKIKVLSKFNLKLADYGVTFEKGKPSTNIAKIVEVTVDAEY